MVKVERIGSVEHHGDYRYVRVAVNDIPLAPIWFSAPEFQSYEQMGDERMWQMIGLRAAVADEEARRQVAEAISDLASSTRR